MVSAMADTGPTPLPLEGAAAVAAACWARGALLTPVLGATKSGATAAVARPATRTPRLDGAADMMDKGK